MRTRYIARNERPGLGCGNLFTGWHWRLVLIVLAVLGGSGWYFQGQGRGRHIRRTGGLKGRASEVRGSLPRSGKAIALR